MQGNSQVIELPEELLEGLEACSCRCSGDAGAGGGSKPSPIPGA